MHRFRRTVVALEDGESDEGLIPYAAMLARLGAMTDIRFVRMRSRGDSAKRIPALSETEQRVEQSFGEIASSAQFCFDLDDPLPEAQLAALATRHQADLILVGCPPDHPLPKWQIASPRRQARRLAMQAPCSVWIVPRKSPPRLRRILVPINFNKRSADALSVAVEIAREDGAAECLPLNVFGNAAVLAWEEAGAMVREEKEAAYRAFIEPIDCQGVTLTPLFLEGNNIARTICQAALEQLVDLKIVCTRARTPAAALFSKGVSSAVIARAHSPVLVLKDLRARLSLPRLLLKRFFRKGDPSYS